MTMHACDQITIGTHLHHPDGVAVVTGETRTSWKATRHGHELTIAKDTMVARGNNRAGYSGHKYVTVARFDRSQAEGLLRKRIAHLAAVSDLEALTAAVTALDAAAEI